MRQKILLLSYRDIRHPEMGGAEIIIHEIYRRLQAQGHEVTYLTCRFPGGAAREDLDGVETIRIGNLYNFNFAVGSYYKEHLRDRGYTLIVEDLNKLPFYSPVFQKQVPVLVNVPHLFGTTVFQQAKWPLAMYVYLQERTIPRVYRDCLFQVLSDSTRDDLEQRGIPPQRMRVIRSGIDHQAHVPPPGGRGVPEEPVIIYLGRLKRYKCIEHPLLVLPRLRAKVPAAEYWIVGEGDYREPLERMAESAGVRSAVRFFGFKEGMDKLDLLHRSRVLAYTSPKEGWGLSVIEANATGLPCVASNSPGLRESVRDGETGYLVPHGDLDTLYQRFLALLSDDALWLRMSREALKWAAGFNWDNMAAETLEWIEEAVRRGRGNGLAGGSAAAGGAGASREAGASGDVGVSVDVSASGDVDASGGRG